MMTRKGMNPARGKNTSYRPAKVTVATVTYIPGLDGFFKHQLDILKLTLASIRAHTELPINIMVFNNGSCSEVSEYLKKQLEYGTIDYLISSRKNIGIIGAFKIMFQAAPSEFIAYSDDDVFYYPGWLPAQLEILKTYPKVGMVSGAPVGYSTTNASVSLEKFINKPPLGLKVSSKPRELSWEKDWAISTGRNVDQHIEEVAEFNSTLLTYNGVSAIGSAKHFQFLTKKDIINKALPDTWSGDLMDGLVELDRAVDQLGYLRLSTPKRFSRHLGNVLSPQIVQEAEKFGISTSKAKPINIKRHWLLNIRGSGRVLRLFYNWLFRVLYEFE